MIHGCRHCNEMLVIDIVVGQSNSHDDQFDTSRSVVPMEKGGAIHFGHGSCLRVFSLPPGRTDSFPVPPVPAYMFDILWRCRAAVVHDESEHKPRDIDLFEA